MESYEDVERRVNRQGTLLFRIKRLFIDVEVFDPEDVESRRQSVSADFESIKLGAQQVLTDIEDSLRKLREGEGSVETVIGEPIGEIEDIQKSALELRTKEAQYLKTAEQDRLAELSDELGSIVPRVEASAEFGMVFSDAKNLRTTVSHETAPQRTTGGPLPDSLDVTADELTQAAERLRSVTRENAINLPDEAVQRAESLRKRINSTARYLSEKRRFDEQMPDAEQAVDSVLESAEPYLSYDAYLTDPKKERLQSKCQVATPQVAEVRDALSLTALARGDRRRLQRNEAAIERVSSRLVGYNEVFVPKQRAQYADMFQDVDEAGNDLNPAQQRAIIRNGYYNQVVAGAGTGKTLTLVYRIAYLVEQGVDPDAILALTFTKEAAKEMENRLENELGVAGVDVGTIHSFAFGVASEHADGSLSVANGQDLRNVIDEALDDPSEFSEDFAQHYRDFIAHHEHPFPMEADFEEKTDYIAERKARTYETLAGETVASRAEALIADFLFTHNVTYRYEQVAEWADTADDKGPYRPEFYLPDDDVYIEHWGIDESGTVPEWFSWSTETYRSKIEWARNQFANSDDRDLVGTYEFEHESGSLRRVLKHRLDAAGVELDEMDFDTFVEEAYTYTTKRGDVTDSFRKFVRNAKMFRVSPDDVPERLTRSHPEQYHFGHAARVIYERYESMLEDAGLVDFEDMINDSIEAVKTEPEKFSRRFDHVIVDEFQDVSVSEFELIDELSGVEQDTRLFCVGDDWQSIYSFRGAEVEQFVNFGSIVGPPDPVVTRLTTNYRCPSTVVETSNELISQNPRQIEKTVESAKPSDSDPMIHLLNGYQDSDYEDRVVAYTLQLIEQFLSDGSPPEEIMILCRYDEGAPFLRAIKHELEKHGIPYDGKSDQYRPTDEDRHSTEDETDGGVSIFSVHSAKGRQAKHVVVVNVVSGSLGFPAEAREDQLIDPVRDTNTENIAEERRLFYVALTRTTDELHVISRPESESPFLTSIEDFFEWKPSVTSVDKLGDRVTITAQVDRVFDDPYDKQEQAGILEDDTGETQFVSWSSDDPPTVEPGVWYRFVDVRVDEFRGEKRIVLDSSCQLVRLFGPGPETAVDAAGAITDGRSGSEPPTTGGIPDIELSYDQLDTTNPPVGHGGDTVVYSATVSTGDGTQQLAVKEPNTDDELSAETVSRFLNGSQDWGRIDAHDHVADVAGWGNDPYPWVATELLDGGPLSDRVGTMELDEALWVLTSIASALQYAHERGVVHHALTPENVRFLSTASGYWDVPKVLDWGIGDRPKTSEEETSVHNSLYAAPEQTTARPEEPDERTDVFQIGLLAYELTTGEHPFAETVPPIDSWEFTDPSVFNDSVPEGLDDVINRSLAVDPTSRQDDPLEFRREVGSLR